MRESRKRAQIRESVLGGSKYGRNYSRTATKKIKQAFNPTIDVKGPPREVSDPEWYKRYQKISKIIESSDLTDSLSEVWE